MMESLVDSNEERSPQASIVIPAHNAEATIGRQLASIEQQVECPSFEVIVVLNRCTDGTARVCESFLDRVPNLQIVEANDRPSAGYARNVGAARAKGIDLLFCDADDELDPLWVSSMVSGLADGDVVAGILAPDPDGMPPWLLRLPGVLRTETVGLTLFDDRIWYPPTACFGCHRHDFLAVSGFSEEFHGATSEDLDLAVRLLTVGCRLVAVPQARLRYSLRSTYRALRAQQLSYAKANAAVLSADSRFSTRKTSHAAWDAIRRSGWLAVRRKELDIRVLLARVDLATRLSMAHNRAGRNIANKPSMAVNFVVRPSAPLIGGLGFSFREPQRIPSANTSPPTCFLAAIDEFVRAGDHVVTCAWGAGMVTAAAMTKVGAGGEVTLLGGEADTAVAMENLRRLERHVGPTSGVVHFRTPAVSAEPLEMDCDADVIVVDLSSPYACGQLQMVTSSMPRSRVILLSTGRVTDSGVLTLATAALRDREVIDVRTDGTIEQLGPTPLKILQSGAASAVVVGLASGSSSI